METAHDFVGLEVRCGVRGTLGVLGVEVHMTEFCQKCTGRGRVEVHRTAIFFSETAP